MNEMSRLTNSSGCFVGSDAVVMALSVVLCAILWLPVAGYSGEEPQYDYGDAPDPTYPTLLSSGGASHQLGTDVYLGASVDGEADGMPTIGANGDDTSGTADEDGVTFLTCMVVGANTQVEVVANAPCTLSAWIDFNADGDWEDAGETLFPGGQLLAAGANILDFAVSAAAATGATYARFRCATEGVLAQGGPAADGEVEDYLVNVQSSPCELWTLSIAKAGNGSGVVTSSPEALIDCGGTCSRDCAAGSVVTLLATPDDGSRFSGWTGDSDCADGKVKMDADIHCIANFNRFPWLIFAPAIVR